MRPSVREAPGGAHPGEKRLRWLAWGILVVGLVVIIRMTLAPGSAQDRIPGSFLCLLCGHDGLANLLRNVLLFFPLGVSLGVLARRPVPAWMGAVALSILIEGLQTQLPGRNPLLVDILSNGSGAGLGILVGAAVRTRVGNASSGRTPLAADPRPWMGLALAILLATGWLLSLSPPSPPHYVQWTARLGHLEVYEGTLREARLEGRPLQPGRHPDPSFLSRGLTEGGLLELEMEAGPPPPGTAPVFSVFNDRREELFLLGVAGKDLVVHLPHRGVRLGLANPHLRAWHGLAGVGTGERVEVGFRLHPGEACFTLDGAEHCEARPSLAKGWALLLFPPRLGPNARGVVSTLWLMAVAFPAVFLAPSVGRGIRNGALLAAISVAVPLLPIFGVPLAPWTAGGLLLGTGLGLGLRWWLGLGRGCGMAPAETESTSVRTSVPTSARTGTGAPPEAPCSSRRGRR